MDAGIQIDKLLSTVGKLLLAVETLPPYRLWASALSLSCAAGGTVAEVLGSQHGKLLPVVEGWLRTDRERRQVKETAARSGQESLSMAAAQSAEPMFSNRHMAFYK